MFCGLIIKPGQKIKLDSTQGEILHLSQACLSEPKDNGRVYVQAIDGGNAYTICSLQKGTIEHASLDLFLSTSADIELSVIGKNEVHISGFYEPEMEEDFDDEDALMGMSDEEDEEQLELEDSKVENKKNLKRKLPTKSDESTDEEVDDEEIDSDEADDLDLDELIQDNDDDEDEDDGDDEDDDEEDLDDLDDEEDEEPVKVPSTKNKNKQSSGSQKIKSSDSQPPSKKSRVESKSQSKPDQLYEESIIDFLKKNGRTNMAMIGNKIKRPEGVSKKLGSFISERTDLFKVENNMISLVK
ncbi:nuclear factor NF3 [Cryptosporidium sp. chipmunk genotype I]|uniref:nuclear factor NF3 n=1 Tax=Cryptosporidium sp. chipmunk genotype I TaxID=1280935 RepID=UPI00351A88C3|nr:nuclear factor NF3 [Cryptosporidium sp. chipmunk genotype I]